MPEILVFYDLRFPRDGSVLNDVSLTVGSSERVVLYGPNGGGKSSILRVIAGTANAGAVRSDIAYLPQRPHMFRGTLEKNLRLGLTREERDTAFELADLLGLGGILDADARGLSGGQAQRVGIARTLAMKAGLVLLDEPLAPITGVDRDAVVQMIRDRTEGRALICVTHSIETVVAVGDRVVILDEGRVLQDGPPAEVMTTPNSDRVAEIVGIGNVVTGTVIATDNGMAELECDGFRLFVLTEAERSDAVTARFGAESVALYRQRPTGGSQRNVIRGTVATVIVRGRLIEVIVDVGCPIAALVTPGALDSLDLVVGDDVWLTVKTAAISVTRIGR